MLSDYNNGSQPEPLFNDLETANEWHHQLPYYELFAGQELHQHECSACGNAFLCEDRHCELGDKGCEECEIASKRVTPSTNRERLFDCLDDQGVIEEIKLQIDREFAFQFLQWESYIQEPWGGAFRNSRAQKDTKHNQPKSRRSHNCRVRRTLEGKGDNAQ